MTNTNATNLRKNLLNVNTKSGNAIIMSEEEYNGMVETLRLLSIPGMKERLEEGVNTPLEDCEDFEW